MRVSFPKHFIIAFCLTKFIIGASWVSTSIVSIKTKKRLLYRLYRLGSSTLYFEDHWWEGLCPVYWKVGTAFQRGNRFTRLHDRALLFALRPSFDCHRVSLHGYHVKVVAQKSTRSRAYFQPGKQGKNQQKSLENAGNGGDSFRVIVAAVIRANVCDVRQVWSLCLRLTLRDGFPHTLSRTRKFGC